MIDLLPFPRITGDTPQKQVLELINYLVQFKETLEFTLMNISTENLSPDLVKKLNDLGANIVQSTDEKESELAQISKGNNLTVYDVCNSNIFKASIESNISSLTFNVNTETGELEYSIKQDKGG